MQSRIASAQASKESNFLIKTQNGKVYRPGRKRSIFNYSCIISLDIIASSIFRLGCQISYNLAARIVNETVVPLPKGVRYKKHGRKTILSRRKFAISLEYIRRHEHSLNWNFDAKYICIISRVTLWFFSLVMLYNICECCCTFCNTLYIQHNCWSFNVRST